MSRRRLNTQATSRRQVNWTTASSWRRPGMRLQEQWPPAKDESSTTSVASAASLILPNPVDWRAFQSPRPFPSFSSPPPPSSIFAFIFRSVASFASPFQLSPLIHSSLVVSDFFTFSTSFILLFFLFFLYFLAFSFASSPPSFVPHFLSFP